MSIPNDLLADDLERIFQDWQEPVTYRRVSSTYDPQTQTRSETLTDTVVQGVVRTVTSRPVPRTASAALAGDVLVLIRDAEIPERPPRRSSRLVHNSNVYEIVGYQHSTDGFAWQIQTRRV